MPRDGPGAVDSLRPVEAVRGLLALLLAARRHAYACWTRPAGAAARRGRANGNLAALRGLKPAILTKPLYDLFILHYVGRDAFNELARLVVGGVNIQPLPEELVHCHHPTRSLVPIEETVVLNEVVEE
jgi:hypothetical protein